MNQKEKLQEATIKALQEDTKNILGPMYRDKKFCGKDRYEELKSVIKNDLQNIRKELKIKNPVRYKTEVIELNDGTLYGEEFIGILSLTNYEGTYPEEQDILNKYGYSLNNIGSSGVVSTTYGYNKNYPEINVEEINNGEALYTVFYASVLYKYDESNNLREDYNDEVQDVIQKANEQLKELKSSQELVDIVENYLEDNFGNGYPLYLVSKKGGWMLYAGTIVDENKAHFLVSDTVSTRIVDYRLAYKYYHFSNTYRG